ncbi:exosortase/archaeosortase family protein [Stieleria sp. TO1_6]|uniref:exosortase/archaeosortase family protein n=1 Tax=Stieleria tagensis TaxID=2956795 RepID=UPI00209B6004|nr:exosortase/archaeosortase family protein [Stieleria tagensis]MCO8122485.1 exosortase/archaeosortase family protein [Stieleria tagensis]
MGRSKQDRTSKTRSRKSQSRVPGVDRSSDSPAAGGKQGRSGSGGSGSDGRSGGWITSWLGSEPLVAFPSPAKWPARYWQVLAVLLAVFLFSYWPTLRWMADAWINEPDYSHGWGVPLLAVMICYYRSELFPGAARDVSWGGLSLIVVAIVMRILGRFAYFDFFDGWSMLPMIAGAVWCLLGIRAAWWALPAIGFLMFAVPMPYQMESMLSWKLQGVATELSTIFLRVLGQPAVSEGHVIWIGSERMGVEEACSGLRIFVGMAAFAYYWAAINLRGWSDKLVILASAIPAAILVNALRITVIGLAYSWTDNESARRWAHDISGILMIFASFAMMWGVNAYWQNLFAPVRKLTAKEMMRESDRVSANSL